MLDQLDPAPVPAQPATRRPTRRQRIAAFHEDCVAAQTVSPRGRAYARLIAAGQSVEDAYRTLYPTAQDRQVRERAPLLARDPLIAAEIARQRGLGPEGKLLERTEALIEGGQLRPDKELEAIEFASALRTRIYAEQEAVKTPADLDAFMLSVIDKTPGLFR